MVNYKRGSGNYKSSYLQIVIKKASTDVTTETTVQDDSELFLSLKANRYYAGFIYFFLLSPATADIKYTFKAITGTVKAEYTKGFHTSPQGTLNFGTNGTNSTDGGSELKVLPFNVQMGATAGILQFQWAQNISDAGQTFCLKGSMIVCYEA